MSKVIRIIELMETKIALVIVVKGRNGTTGFAGNAADHRHERPQWTDMMRQN
jgi:hypothetical protein